jgi:hypothetical protein
MSQATHYITTLLVGGTEQEREQKILDLTTDVRFQRTLFDCRDKKGIAQVRELVQTLIFKPTVEKRAIITILEMQLLSSESQTTLLKLIEEPPLGLSMYISADYPENLLATIVSRCKIVTLPKSGASSIDVDSFFSQPLSKQFDQLDLIDIDTIIKYLHAKLTTHQDSKVPTIIRTALKLKKKTNQTPVNKKLVKEYLLLEVSTIS